MMKVLKLCYLFFLFLLSGFVLADYEEIKYDDVRILFIADFPFIEETGDVNQESATVIESIINKGEGFHLIQCQAGIQSTLALEASYVYMPEVLMRCCFDKDIPRSYLLSEDWWNNYNDQYPDAPFKKVLRDGEEDMVYKQILDEPKQGELLSLSVNNTDSNMGRLLKKMNSGSKDFTPKAEMILSFTHMSCQDDGFCPAYQCVGQHAAEVARTRGAGSLTIITPIFRAGYEKDWLSAEALSKAIIDNKSNFPELKQNYIVNLYGKLETNKQREVIDRIKKQLDAY